jgi:hypothetical protein
VIDPRNRRSPQTDRHGGAAAKLLSSAASALPLSGPDRMAIAAALVPHEGGIVLWRLPAPLSLPTGEECTEIAVYREIDAEESAPVTVVSVFFCRGEGVKDQCAFEIHYDLSADGEVIEIDLPRRRREGANEIKESVEYSAAASGPQKLAELTTMADGFHLQAAARAPRGVSREHALCRRVKVETYGGTPPVPHQWN